MSWREVNVTKIVLSTSTRLGAEATSDANAAIWVLIASIAAAITEANVKLVALVVAESVAANGEGAVAANGDGAVVVVESLAITSAAANATTPPVSAVVAVAAIKPLVVGAVATLVVSGLMRVVVAVVRVLVKAFVSVMSVLLRVAVASETVSTAVASVFTRLSASCVSALVMAAVSVVIATLNAAIASEAVFTAVARVLVKFGVGPGPVLTTPFPGFVGAFVDQDVVWNAVPANPVTSMLARAAAVSEAAAANSGAGVLIKRTGAVAI